MRQDQPKLAEAFKGLKDQINLLQRQVAHREGVVDSLVTKTRDLELAVKVGEIEHDRLLLGKPALTKRYALARQLMLEIQEIL
jgi:hypothetical protein